MGEKEQATGEGAAERTGGFIKMAGVEGERFKFGTAGESPAGIAVSDPGAPGDKGKSQTK